MNRPLLEQPFAADEIKHREGHNGKALAYVEGHTVIARLNDAFDGNWNFEITDHGIDEKHSEVHVLGRLTAEGVVKMQYGSSSLTRDKRTKEIISVGDSVKSAATDALKKCATLFGVGLHLYSDKTQPREESAPSPEPLPVTPAPQTPGRISAKQHSFILNLARGRGMTRRELDAMCQERFQVVLDHVTRSEASMLIEEFSATETLSQTPQSSLRNHGGVH